MQTSTSRAPVVVFWNSFDFSQLINWVYLASRLRRQVKVHTSSGSLLIWSHDWKELFVSSFKSFNDSTGNGPVLATLSISRIRDHFPLLFDR